MIKVLEWLGLYITGRIGLYIVDAVVINCTKTYPKLWDTLGVGGGGLISPVF